MYELKKNLDRYLRVNLRLVKRNLPGRGLTKVEKHGCEGLGISCDP